MNCVIITYISAFINLILLQLQLYTNMVKALIILRPFVHKNVPQIGIYFDYDDTVKACVKSFAGVRWSQTHRVFYVRDNWDHRQLLFRFFNEKGFYVDYNALRAVAVLRL